MALRVDIYCCLLLKRLQPKTRARAVITTANQENKGLGSTFVILFATLWLSRQMVSSSGFLARHSRSVYPVAPIAPAYTDTQTHANTESLKGPSFSPPLPHLSCCSLSLFLSKVSRLEQKRWAFCTRGNHICSGNEFFWFFFFFLLTKIEFSKDTLSPLNVCGTIVML